MSDCLTNVLVNLSANPEPKRRLLSAPCSCLVIDSETVRRLSLGDDAAKWWSDRLSGFKGEVYFTIPAMDMIAEEKLKGLLGMGNIRNDQPAMPEQSPPLQIGSRVMLNSGGPWMTVTQMNADEPASVWAFWFDDQRQAHRELVPTVCLRQKTAVDDVTYFA